MQPRIKKGKTSGQHAGISLNAADKHPVEFQRQEIVDDLPWRRITVFDEYAICRNKRLVMPARLPAELPLEGRHAFIMTLDGGNAGHGQGECGYFRHQPSRRIEARLDVDDIERLFHASPPTKNPSQ
ncbi:hypothetical protein D3C72_1614860 [compost metagenome]